MVYSDGFERTGVACTVIAGRLDSVSLEESAVARESEIPELLSAGEAVAITEKQMRNVRNDTRKR
jgi:hypothetical protein